MGIVEHIFLSNGHGEPMTPVRTVEAETDRGLIGDRYADLTRNRPRESQVTLIESEAIRDFVDATGLPLELFEPRRNIVTSGVELNDFLGKTFQVGNVELHALDLCEPCKTFATRTHPEVLKFFVHRGGLRCRVLSGGAISVGDKLWTRVPERTPEIETERRPR